jgi:hypothetical protein
MARTKRSGAIRMSAVRTPAQTKSAGVAFVLFMHRDESNTCLTRNSLRIVHKSLVIPGEPVNETKQYMNGRFKIRRPRSVSIALIK